MTEEADKDWSHRQLDDVLVELAANLLRVVAGAGRAWEIPRQAADVVVATEAYIKAHGCGPSDWDIGRTLTDWKRDPRTEREYMYEEIAVGGMRFVASNMLGQGTQAIAGKRLIAEAIRRDEARRNAPPPRRPTAKDEQEAAEAARRAMRYLVGKAQKEPRRTR